MVRMASLFKVLSSLQMLCRSTSCQSQVSELAGKTWCYVILTSRVSRCDRSLFYTACLNPTADRSSSRVLLVNIYIHEGVLKSLARPGRKQATSTKLGIYSTYSPRNSIHFLARCSNFCKPLKNNSEGCPSNQVSAARMTSASDEKWRPFNFKEKTCNSAHEQTPLSNDTIDSVLRHREVG
jgi:hypothetical protein